MSDLAIRRTEPLRGNGINFHAVFLGLSLLCDRHNEVRSYDPPGRRSIFDRRAAYTNRGCRGRRPNGLSSDGSLCGLSRRTAPRVVGGRLNRDDPATTTRSALAAVRIAVRCLTHRTVPSGGHGGVEEDSTWSN